MKDLKNKSGYWWMPDNPSRRYPGTLSFDSIDGARLDLLIEEALPSLTRTIEEYPLIYGITDQGRDISLLNCYRMNGRWSAAGISTHSIFGHFVLEGFHLPSVDGANIRGISATVPFLSSWLGSTGVNITHSEDFREFNIAYRQPSPLTAKISPSIQMKISMCPGSIPLAGSPGAGVSIQEKTWLSLEPDEPQPYGQLLANLQSVFDFFTFVCMDLCVPEVIQLKGNFNPRIRTDEVPVYPTADLHFMPIYTTKKKRSPHPMDLLLRYSHFDDSFLPVLSRWMELAHHLKEVRVLYVSALYGEHTFVENKFLSMCQAAEVFHRRFRLGEYMDSAKYKSEVLPFLISRMPTDLKPEFTDAVRQKFEYLNEFSLAKRLKELVSESKDVIVELVPEITEVMREIVEARNRFTHYSAKHEQGDIDGERILYYAYVLRLIVDISVLKEIGVPPHVLTKAALGSELYRRMLRLKQS